jgi:hypothetical protein
VKAFEDFFFHILKQTSCNLNVFSSPVKGVNEHNRSHNLHTGFDVSIKDKYPPSQRVDVNLPSTSTCMSIVGDSLPMAGTSEETVSIVDGDRFAW